MLKIFQARLQQYMTHDLPDVKLVLEKAEEPEIKLQTSTGSLKRQESSRKNMYFCFIDYTKAFDSVDQTNCEKFLKRWEYQTILSVFSETYTWVKKQQLGFYMDWFKIGKGVQQGYILSPWLFNLYAEYSMPNARLDEL